MSYQQKPKFLLPFIILESAVAILGTIAIPLTILTYIFAYDEMKAELKKQLKCVKCPTDGGYIFLFLCFTARIGNEIQYIVWINNLRLHTNTASPFF